MTHSNPALERQRQAWSIESSRLDRITHTHTHRDTDGRTDRQTLKRLALFFKEPRDGNGFTEEGLMVLFSWAETYLTVPC